MVRALLAEKAIVAAVILLAQPAAHAAEGDRPWLDELRAGGSVLSYGGSYVASGRVEALFSPLPHLPAYDPMVAWLLSPRPFVGATIGFQHQTNELFGGLTWSVPIPRPFLLEFSTGGLVHDQELFAVYANRPELTTRFLFRQSIAIGYQIDPQWRILAFAEHGSNGRLGFSNLSMNRVGVELGRTFGNSVVETPPAAMPAISTFNWTGPYAGVNAGMTLGGYSTAAFAPPNWHAVSSFTDRSLITGGQVGYNVQFGSLVVGAEGDFSFQGINSGYVAPVSLEAPNVPFDDQYLFLTPWMATARLRAGVDIEPAFLVHRVLVFATGGAAFVKVAESYCRYNGNCYNSAGGAAGGWTTERTIKEGWTAGGGVEIPLAANVTTKLEYLYADFGQVTLKQGGSVANLQFSEQFIRAGLNFNFGGFH